MDEQPTLLSNDYFEDVLPGQSAVQVIADGPLKGSSRNIRSDGSVAWEEVHCNGALVGKVNYGAQGISTIRYADQTALRFQGNKGALYSAVFPVDGKTVTQYYDNKTGKAFLTKINEKALPVPDQWLQPAVDANHLQDVVNKVTRKVDFPLN